MINKIFFLLLVVPMFIWSDSAVLAVDKKAFYVSQKVIVTLTLDTAAFDFSDLDVDVGDNQDCIITKPDLNANNSITNSFGMVIQAPTYQFFIYPQKVGKLELKPFRVTYNKVQNYAENSKKVKLASNTVSIDVISPEGAPDGVFVLVTPELNVTTTYKSDTSQIKIGDAFERTIKIKAVNVPDVLIEAVETPELKEFNVYPGDPILKEEHSGADAKITYAYRIQKENFVAIAEGEALIPTKKLYWFDGKVLHTATTEQKKITVISTPDSEADAKGSSRKSGWLTALLSILLLAAILYLSRSKIKNFFQTKKESYEQSEKGYFHQLLKVNQQGSVVEVYEAFYRWIDVAMNGTNLFSFEDIVTKVPLLQSSVDQLQQGLVTPEDFDRQAFEKEIKLQRVQIIKKISLHPYSLIHSMN